MSTSAPKPPFLAFVSDSADVETLKEFAASHQWDTSGIHVGDVSSASAYLKSNPSPVVLVVELPSAGEAPALLDELANVCDPETKVITIGAVNEYSFYCWLMDLGIFSYLLKPLSHQALEGAYVKSVAPPSGGKAERPPGKVIAAIGTRGGVGATTLVINLAGVLAETTKKQVALVDIDPQEGSVALALDLEPSRGLRDALEKPDRIDSLFIERVMNKPLKNLSVLSAEEALHDRLVVHDHAADALLRELRSKFDLVILDIPRYLSNFSRQCLRQAEHVVLATDLTLLSLRDALRIGDMMRETLKMKPPVVVATRVGFAPKQEMPINDFEKGINGKIAHRVPFAPDLFMPIASDIPAVKHKGHAAAKPIYALAHQLIPEARGGKVETAKPKAAGITSLFKKEH